MSADQVMGLLAAARASIGRATSTAEDVRRYAGSAERALDDVEAEHARFSMVPHGSLGVSHLTATIREVEVLRSRSAVSASTALEVQEELEAAREQVEGARRILNGRAPGTVTASREMGELRAQLDHLAGVLDLASPLAAAATEHLTSASQIATRIATHSIAEDQREAVVAGVGVSLSAAVRELARGEVTARHLDHTMGYVTTTAGRALAGADAFSGAAHDTSRSPHAPAGSDLGPGMSR